MCVVRYFVYPFAGNSFELYAFISGIVGTAAVPMYLGVVDVGVFGGWGCGDLGCGGGESLKRLLHLGMDCL